MTFGEKMKQARKEASLSQEQLAEKLCVSRSAIAKWETDKGLPDVGNLKAIARLLQVSIDYLLEDGEKSELSVTREPIELASYGKGRKKIIKDRIVRESYPDAEIVTLIAKEKLTKGEKVMDTLIWLISPLVNAMEITKGLNNLDKEFYLVSRKERQYLVMITDEYIESRALPVRMEKKKFEIGSYVFMNCGPIRYA